MNTTEILEAYNMVSAQTEATTGQALPTLQTEGYTLEAPKVTTYTSESEVWQTISDFGGACGWLAYQSGNQHQLELALIEANTSYGCLLNAELANDKNQSMNIRYNGQGGWTVVIYSYAVGGDYIVDRVSYLSSFDNGKKLNYLRFWKAGSDDQTLGINPAFACFIGFGG